MKIVGIGIDICKNDRIESLINQYSQNFLHKIYHQDEIDLCISKYNKLDSSFFAKRFAGKEAFVKAIGFGFNGYIKKSEILILSDNISGKPYIEIIGGTKTYISTKFANNLDIQISLSDEREFSIANVIIVEI